MTIFLSRDKMGFKIQGMGAHSHKAPPDSSLKVYMPVKCHGLDKQN